MILKAAQEGRTEVDVRYHNEVVRRSLQLADQLSEGSFETGLQPKEGRRSTNVSGESGLLHIGYGPIGR